MKLGVLVIFVIGWIISGNTSEIVYSSSTHIRVINQTNNHFTNVALFSMPFDDLKPKDTSAYHLLKFNELKDDSLIYCTVGDTNYARYLEIPTADKREVSFVIDSIYNGMLYVSTKY